MVTMIKLLVAFIKVMIFFAKLFANADVLAGLYEKLEELEKQEENAQQ
ncbi:MAG: hypothetical protein IJO14_08670 [Clostridia bacterium]|nr:hypothetical protein [Clostridia bacterium]